MSWLLTYYGRDNVKLLNGGRTQWTLEDRPIETGRLTPTPGTFTSGAPRDQWRATVSRVQEAIGDSDIMLIDALPAEMYTGEAEHSPPIRAGHIPAAKNLPTPDNLDPTAPALLPRDELGKHWAALGLQEGQEAITYCESGVFSALDLFVLYQLGHEKLRLYETSLMEWGTDPSYPMETGSVQ